MQQFLFLDGKQPVSGAGRAILAFAGAAADHQYCGICLFPDMVDKSGVRPEFGISAPGVGRFRAISNASCFGLSLQSFIQVGVVLSLDMTGPPAAADKIDGAMAECRDPVSRDKGKSRIAVFKQSHAFCRGSA